MYLFKPHKANKEQILVFDMHPKKEEVASFRREVIEENRMQLYQVIERESLSIPSKSVFHGKVNFRGGIYTPIALFKPTQKSEEDQLKEKSILEQYIDGNYHDIEPLIGEIGGERVGFLTNDFYQNNKTTCLILPLKLLKLQLVEASQYQELERHGISLNDVFDFLNLEYVTEFSMIEKLKQYGLLSHTEYYHIMQKIEKTSAIIEEYHYTKKTTQFEGKSFFDC